MHARTIDWLPAAGLGAVMVSAAVARGDQSGPMSFQNVTSIRVVETVPETTENWKIVDAGDYDQDGDMDVVIANALFDSARANKLYRNDGGILTEVSGTAVIPGFDAVHSDLSRNATFADLDGDGWLDILVVNGFQSSMENRTKVFMNKQIGGVFSHFEEEGLDRLPDLGQIPGSWGAVVFDPDEDGDLDFFVAADGQDRMFFNDGAGFFTDVTLSHLPIDTYDAIDVASGDLNGDGHVDLLVSNWQAPSMLYYNGLAGGAAGGDAGYFNGPAIGLPPGGNSESTMVADEFGEAPGEGGGGAVDFYRANGSDDSPFEDFLYRNLGNDDQGMAEFKASALTQRVSYQVSCKPSAADLNGDGRAEIIVTASSARPVILRNTSVGEQISFVDWTPAPAFPNTFDLSAWDVAVLDSNDDGDLDILVGGYAHEHLFEQVPGPSFEEAELTGGVLPAMFDADPLAVLGEADAGETDTYTAEDIGPGGFVSIVLNGPDDYRLAVRDQAGMEIAAADRGGLGVEEALQVWATGTLLIDVSVLDDAPLSGAEADLNGDGMVDLSDLIEVLLAWGPCGPDCHADIDGSGAVDVDDLLAVLRAWGPVGTGGGYVLELLARGG